MPEKRLLLVSFHFPPSQAAGALRWERLSAHAVRRGWGVDALTLAPEQLPASDPVRAERLPDAVRVVGVRAREPRITLVERLLQRLARRLRTSPASRSAAAAPASGTVRRGSFARDALRFAPWRPRDWLRAYDAWVDYARSGDWARRAARAGRERFAPGVHRAVVSCGPPHMAHEGGRRLAAATGLPFVMDLRDPWSLWERLPAFLASPLWLRLAARHEARCVRAAALVVMNTEPARRAMQARYPDAADRIVCVPNGCDDEEVPKAEGEDGRFVVAYAGAVYLDRNPRTLFRAAARVIRERGLGPADLSIEFMGTIEGVDGDWPLQQIAAEEGVAEFLVLRPPGTRDRAMAFLARAGLLVNLPQDSHLAIPSKIYEYMRFPLPLLALAEPHSATAELLRGTSAAVVAPADVDACTAVLRRCFDDHRAGRRPRPIAADPRFARTTQADRLFDALDAIAGGDGGAA